MPDNYPTSLIKTVPELLVLIYKDLAQPGVRKVGQALASVLDLFNTILLPLKLLNEKTRITFEHNLEKYKKRLDEIPNEDIAEVAPEIGIPILDKLTYVRDENISDLFVNLLTNASSTKTNNLAHPSFINFINNLSPDEAKIISYLSDKTGFPFITIKAVSKKLGYIPIMKYAFIDISANLSFPENIEAYISNFIGLGFITSTPGEYWTDEKLYTTLIKAFDTIIEPKLRNRYSKKDYEKIEYEKGVFHISEYGRMFIQACSTIK